MYAVIVSGSCSSSLSDAVKQKITCENKVKTPIGYIDSTQRNIQQILSHDVKKLQHWIHSKKPWKSKSKNSKFY